MDSFASGTAGREAFSASPAPDDYLRSGWETLDALLPHGGFPRGALVEWLGRAGSGAGLLALLAARAALASSLPLVVIDAERRFYPPAAAAWGLSEKDFLLVHPATARETLWALDQALRCRGVAAVWAVLEELAPHPFRRLQLAAEEGRGLGCLVRPLRARGRPSWAEVQLVVQPLPRPLPVLSGRRWRIELTRYRGITRDGMGPGVVELELDERGREISCSTRETPRHATDSVPLVPC